MGTARGCRGWRRFRGRRFRPALLEPAGRPLALCGHVLGERATLIDPDDPSVLVNEGLHPSAVATGRRDVAQRAADVPHRSHPDVVGPRWWSVVEASWINVALLSERAATHLRPDAPRGLGPEEDAVVAARRPLGLV